MRCLHVIPSLSLKHGGPSRALPAMVRALAEQGMQVDVVTTDDDGTGLHLQGQLLGQLTAQDGHRVIHFRKQTEFYKVSWPLWRWLMAHAGEYDVVHIHTVFSFSTWAAAFAARCAGVPYIVRPLGVLNAWGMENRRRWVKAVSFHLLDKPLLNRAATMHYTSKQERDEAARLRLKSKAAVVPLGIDLAPYIELPPAALFHQRFPETMGKQLVLFLSRLDPKKNVETLLTALKDMSAHLVVAGSGEAIYVESLRTMAHEFGITERITWTGNLEGELKRSAYAAADVFVLPSRSENFGIALLEAMAAGLACVSTSGVALAAEAAEVGAVRLSTESGLAAEIQALLVDAPSRAQLGRAAAQLAQERYSLSTMAEGLSRLYQSVTSKP